MIITIDPGHGGGDPGAAGIDPRSGHKLLEKDLNLLAARALRDQLEGRFHEVYLTRDGDSAVGLVERARLSHFSKALISIHHNGAASHKARGFELLIDKTEGELNQKQLRLAEEILPGVEPVLARWGIPLRSPPIKNDADDSARGHLTLLEKATVPAVIVEVCFVTNPLELMAATSTAFRVQFAEALAEALTNYEEEYLITKEE